MTNDEGTTNMLDRNAEQQVTNGMRILDEHAPAFWWHDIDLDTLTISEPSNCVLGQVFADEANRTGWTDGYMWATDGNGLPYSENELQYSGFCGNSQASEPVLRETWVHAILIRRLVRA